ncbi:Uncharacterised protein [Mycobacteroides abscessus subsp. massiliense]|nr:Uncharacterised protein [Mycobacteroides abscessus subsp. massiliense]
MDQRDRLAGRVVRCQGHRCVVDQVPALDELDGLRDGLYRKILGQHGDTAAARHSLGHPPPRHRRHVGHHDGDRGASAVGGGQIDIEPRGDVGVVGHHEDVVIREVVRRPLPVQELHM